MSSRFRRALRGAAVIVALPAAVAVTAAPAGACGGLVGENGTIQLEKTSTLAAYHDGIERYVTSFEFTGTGESVGSITPLPGVPTDVTRGGDWTLQRLQREVAPPPPAKGFFESSADQASGAPAEVLLETEVDALDITILKGGGSEVGEWAVDHGFFLTPDAPEVLDFYSRRSQIFMAARFDAKRAAALGQNAGDGTPIMLTIPTEEPWVPLRILSLGLDKSEVVEADVFLLTDTQPKLLAGGPGLSLDRNEQASPELLADLRSDKGMEWVPQSMWFTYLSLDAAAADLDYDLAMATQPGSVPDIADTGVNASEARTITPPSDWDFMPLVIAGLVGVGVFAIFTIGARRRRPDLGAAA